MSKICYLIEDIDLNRVKVREMVPFNRRIRLIHVDEDCFEWISGLMNRNK